MRAKNVVYEQPHIYSLRYPLHPPPREMAEPWWSGRLLTRVAR